MKVSARLFKIPEYTSMSGRITVLIESGLPSILIVLLKRQKVVGCVSIGSEFPDVDLDAVLMHPDAYADFIGTVPPELREMIKAPEQISSSEIGIPSGTTVH